MVRQAQDRQQAATALKFNGILCVIAASSSETYKRNAFNNDLVVFDCTQSRRAGLIVPRAAENLVAARLRPRPQTAQ